MIVALVLAFVIAQPLAGCIDPWCDPCHRGPADLTVTPASQQVNTWVGWSGSTGRAHNAGEMMERAGRNNR